MVDDTPILDVIASAPIGRNWDEESPGEILAALRAAGYDVVPADTAKLGQAVERLPRNAVRVISRIYDMAGVDR